jgi:hypothetical protein
MSVNSKTIDILKRAEDTLDTAKLGLRLLTGEAPENRFPGLRNVVVFGRAVTNVLQNLRSIEPGFNDWYECHKAEMKTDDLMRYFYSLRSEILKKGILNVSTQFHIHSLRLPEDMARFGPPPANARGFFIGDNLGGSGWEVELPDGSTEKYYVQFPREMVSTSFHFPDSPTSHFGRELRESRIEVLSKMYIDYLQQLIQSAKQRFISRLDP